jgi:Ulp1 family protease
MTTKVSYYDTYLDADDLALLKEGEWLNDKVIGFFYE